MKRLRMRFGVAFITFIIGVVSASGWIAHQYQPIEDIPPVHVSPAAEPTSRIPQGWQKINVDGKFSLYLPPDMKEAKLFGDVDDPAQAFSNKALRINYVYSDTRNSCEPDAAMVNQASYRGSQMEAGGRTMTQSIWRSEDTKFFFMTACFPDIDGGGTWLHLGAVSMERRSLEVAKRIFNLIEFP